MRLYTLSVEVPFRFLCFTQPILYFRSLPIGVLTSPLLCSICPLVSCVATPALAAGQGLLRSVCVCSCKHVGVSCTLELWRACEGAIDGVMEATNDGVTVVSRVGKLIFIF